MPKYTDIYSIPYYETDDTITETIEKRRAVTIDNQLYAFATIFGNGVISGWDVEGNLTGFQVSISIGSGMIRWMACETTSTYVLQSLPANRSMDNPIYVYATYTDTSAQDRSVTFFYNTTGVAPAFALLLAKVATDSNGVIEVDTSVKETLDFFANIASEVINHIHIGGDNEPSPIDLVSHVTGQLSQSMIAEIDASKITGQIDEERIAQIQHGTLANIGDNTHNQIDTLLSLLNTTSASLMGDVAFANLLQLILAVKHFWTNIDEYLLNLFAFIPGITADSFIDLINTTTTIDKPNHQLTADIGGVRQAIVKTYGSYDDFNKNISNSNVVLSSGGTIYLTKPSSSTTFEDFTSVTDWSHAVTSSNDSDITKDNSHAEYDVNEIFTVKFYKSFSSEDWTNYNRMQFDFNVAYTEHSAIYFQVVNGSTAQTAVQLLGENATTDGWVTKAIDITSMDRDEVTEVRFYTSVLANDVNKMFNFKVADIYLVSDVYYSSLGTINFVFSTTQVTDWSEIYWSASTPGDSNITVQTRSANTRSDLDYNTFSPALTVSGSSIISSDSKYLEVQININASSDKMNTPILNSFTLNYTTAALASDWEMNTTAEWEAASETETNLTIEDGDLTIASSGGVGAYQFIHSQGVDSGDETIEGIDSNRNRVASLTVSGINLPISPLQANLGLGASFYESRSVQRLETRGYMVADSGNNRVFELDEDGNVIWGTLSNNLSSTDALKPLTATYNENNRELAISFNRNVDADSIDLSKISVVLGTTYIRCAVGSETSSQEDLNFITIVMSVNNANSLADSTGDMSVTIGANAIKDTDGTYLALSYNLDVFEGNVYWTRINNPVHAFKTDDNTYIISHVGGSAYLDPIIELDSTASTQWSFTEVSFSATALGSTEKTSAGDYVIADSNNKRVIKVNGTNDVVDFTREFNYYPSRATKVDNGNYLVTITDDSDGGTGSQIVEVDGDGDVIFSFGLGLLNQPTNATKTNNDHYIITM